ncbi:hypothetical protein DXT87_12210 [Arthrobacter sp. AET 35A]|nr:hypothetical protein [Arthrobacter sp. AET 35A]
MKEIAAVVGVSPATLYRALTTKNGSKPS